jgi:CheY-like chemotaxis protein
MTEQMTKRETKTVLVVDDEPSILEMLDGLLTDEEYRVVTAASGYQALDVISGEIPDVILLDIMMPDLDGREVCRRLRADPRTRKIPVVLMSAAQRISIAEVGADVFLPKPFDLPRLLGIVERLTNAE